jgi:hypothetical protein
MQIPAWLLKWEIAAVYFFSKWEQERPSWQPPQRFTWTLPEIILTFCTFPKNMTLLTLLYSPLQIYRTQSKHVERIPNINGRSTLQQYACSHLSLLPEMTHDLHVLVQPILAITTHHTCTYMLLLFPATGSSCRASFGVLEFTVVVLEVHTATSSLTWSFNS